MLTQVILTHCILCNIWHVSLDSVSNYYINHMLNFIQDLLLIFFEMITGFTLHAFCRQSVKFRLSGGPQSETRSKKPSTRLPTQLDQIDEPALQMYRGISSIKPSLFWTIGEISEYIKPAMSTLFYDIFIHVSWLHLIT